MFSIGIDEPVSTTLPLLRQSIVWLGEACGETSRGLPSTHPICGALTRLLEQVKFVGTWLTCHEVSLLRGFERKALLVRLERAKWTIDPDQSQLIRAHKIVTVSSPWPYGSNPALPWPQSEILVVGCRVDYDTIDCRDERTLRSLHAVRGDSLVLHARLAALLVAEQCYAVSLGRTQTENSPGLSVLGPDGWLCPEDLVEPREVVGVHIGVDAARAWSYGRVDEAPRDRAR
jgi:hypothetical protein